MLGPLSGSSLQAGQILPTDASPFRDRSRTGPSCVARRASKIDERVHYGDQACDCVLQAKFRRGSFGDSILQSARLTFLEKHYWVRKSILPDFDTV